jgi:hypothetical protein
LTLNIYQIFEVPSSKGEEMNKNEYNKLIEMLKENNSILNVLIGICAEITTATETAK